MVGDLVQDDASDLDSETVMVTAREPLDRAAKDRHLVRQHTRIPATSESQRNAAIQTQQGFAGRRFLLDNDLNVRHRGSELGRQEVDRPLHQPLEHVCRVLHTPHPASVGEQSSRTQIRAPQPPAAQAPVDVGRSSRGDADSGDYVELACSPARGALGLNDRDPTRELGGSAPRRPAGTVSRARLLTQLPLWIHNRAVADPVAAIVAVDGSVGRHAKGAALDLIVRQLREEILDGRLRPGERLHQQAVAERFGTSRLPVREALRQLQNEGLVVVHPNAGARVARLAASELDEVYQLRERLEPLLVQRSAGAGVPEGQLATMRRETEWLEEIDPVGREAEWLAHDRSFHMASFAGVSMPRLRSIVESLWNVAEQYRRAYLGLRSGSLDSTMLEHRLLLDAVERRDGDDAARVLEMHIRRTRLGLAAIPELFDA